jgi:diacylglycerol kinase family enzyme
MRRYYVIFNPRSGTALARGLTASGLRGHLQGTGAEIILDDDDHLALDQRLERAKASDADVVVAAGGDGTVTAVAQALVGTGKAMAILPLGTVNLLARDLGIPLELEAWAEALETMQPRAIDVGEVNGEIFLHKVVVGIVPGIAAGREQLRGHMGLFAKIGFVQFFLRRLGRARRMTLELTAEGQARTVRVAAAAVANNAYDEGLGRFFSRQRLDRGQLTVYLLRRLSLADVVRLAVEMVLGRWRRDDALEIEPTAAVSLSTRRGTLKVMLDGEVRSFRTPLRFRIRPLALSVLAPPAPEPAAELAERSPPALATGE